MKIILCILLLLANCNLEASNIIKITDAIATKKIIVPQVVVNGLGNDNLRLTLKNLTNTPQSVVFYPGLMIKPKDIDFQTLIITDSLIVNLKSKAFAVINLTGFCTQPQNIGPREAANYAYFVDADQQLLELAQIINTHKLKDRQRLIWDIIKGYQELELVSENPESAKNAISEFATKYALSTRFSFVNESHAVPKNIISIAANLIFETDTANSYDFDIYHSNGALYKSVFKNKAYQEGMHIIKFGFNAYFPDSTQFVARLTHTAGMLVKEMVVDASTPYENLQINTIAYNYTFTVKKSIEHAKILLKDPNGVVIRTLKEFQTLAPGYHNLHFYFNHYLDAKSKFTLELVDSERTLYDKTEFDAYKKTKKLFQYWK